MTGIFDVPVTLFSNPAARTKCERSLGGFERIIQTTTAATKARLPWLKLARFGQVVTVKGGSLRHDANVVAVTGCEADYDAETVSVEEAVATLTRAGVAAIVYTSPSHTEDTPRWRVLCPFSRELPPGERARHVDRLNGLFHGWIAHESWTLSQAYYFGSVNRNPSHRVELIAGRPLDLMDELDAIAIKPPRLSRTNGRPVCRGIVARSQTGASMGSATTS